MLSLGPGNVRFFSLVAFGALAIYQEEIKGNNMDEIGEIQPVQSEGWINKEIHTQLTRQMDYLKGIIDEVGRSNKFELTINADFYRLSDIWQTLAALRIKHSTPDVQKSVAAGTEMFADALDQFKVRGNFSFKISEAFGEKCNAPADQGGVYLIYKVIDSTETLLYVGASGQPTADGKIKHRKDGMKDRLINGYHPNRFGNPKRIKRNKAFPEQMRKEGVNELRIYWWVTIINGKYEFPTEVEKILIQKYQIRSGKLPDWHQQ